MSITDYARETAAQVLAKCAANDPWFPNGGEATVMAWGEVFAGAGLSREDLLAGVARAYRLAEDGYKPLPASIVRHARDEYFEQLRSLPESQRVLMEEANHVLQDVGVSPPDAHRISRRVALGRPPLVEVPPEVWAEFQARFAERRALAADPHRAAAVLSSVRGSRNPGEGVSVTLEPPRGRDDASVDGGPA